jgi:hypothetical protein
MNNRADSCGQRNDHKTENIFPAGGGRLNFGVASGRERETGARSGGVSVAKKDGVARGASTGAVESGGGSAEGLGNIGGSGVGSRGAAADLSRIPAGVRASVALSAGEYDARRLRSQREIIRDVMLCAADCETWLTLGELRALTRYGEASISAQLRHLRKTENGGYEVVKRHRDGASPARPGTDGRGECVWEYRITRGVCGIETGGTNSGGVNAAA